MNLGPAELIWLAVPLLLALVPARIAERKGYSFTLFYVFGLLVWIAAIIVALLIAPKTERLDEGQLLDGQRL